MWQDHRLGLPGRTIPARPASEEEEEQEEEQEKEEEQEEEEALARCACR